MRTGVSLILGNHHLLIHSLVHSSPPFIDTFWYDQKRVVSSPVSTNIHRCFINVYCTIWIGGLSFLLSHIIPYPREEYPIDHLLSHRIRMQNHIQMSSSCQPWCRPSTRASSKRLATTFPLTCCVLPQLGPATSAASAPHRWFQHTRNIQNWLSRIKCNWLSHNVLICEAI